MTDKTNLPREITQGFPTMRVDVKMPKVKPPKVEGQTTSDSTSPQPGQKAVKE